MTDIDRLAIAITLICAAVLIFCSTLHAAEFTVDERSALHFGASAAIGIGAEATLHYVTKEPQKPIAWAVCMVPGLYKGYVLDSYPDYGDGLFNAIGCLAGVYLADEIFVYADDKTINVAWRF